MISGVVSPLIWVIITVTLLITQLPMKLQVGSLVVFGFSRLESRCSARKTEIKLSEIRSSRRHRVYVEVQG